MREIKFRKFIIIFLKKFSRVHLFAVFQSNKYSLFCGKIKETLYKENFASNDIISTLKLRIVFI